VLINALVALELVAEKFALADVALVALVLLLHAMALLMIQAVILVNEVQKENKLFFTKKNLFLTQKILKTC